MLEDLGCVALQFRIWGYVYMLNLKPEQRCPILVLRVAIASHCLQRSSGLPSFDGF